MALDRLRAARLLAEHLDSALAVSGIASPSFDLFGAGDRERNFYIWGAMGLASSVALGVALCSPKNRVVGFDGDGSTLMNLGALSTIGRYRPENYVLVIFDNGAYEATGGQETHTAHTTDLAAVARACGIERALRTETEDAFTAALDRSLRERGPWFILVPVTVVDRSSPERRAAEQGLKGRYLRKEPFMAQARAGWAPG